MNTRVEEQILELATDAFVWGFPRMLYAKYLRDLRKVSAPMNRFIVARNIATPDEVAANVDTLYGFAWLDLRAEPLVLEVPDTDDRYYSIQMMDVFGDNFAYVGRRTTGTAAARFLVVAPTWQGSLPAGMSLIRSPTRGVCCWMRLLIDGAEDLPAANALQRDFTVTPWLSYPEQRQPPLVVDDLRPYFPKVHNYLERLGPAYFDRLGDALADDPPTTMHDVAAMERFSAAGIGPGLHPADDPAKAAMLGEAITRGMKKMWSLNFNTIANGWSVNLQVRDFITDPLVRASLNRLGMGTLVAEEAIYLMPTAVTPPKDGKVPIWSSLGPDGEPLSGDKRYRLRFAPGALPPVDAFWSLTLYGEDWAMVRNPIDRYAIGDRTRGLQYGADGSLEIAIQHDPPDTGVSNWLPAPPGIFLLMIRAYQPRRSFTDGSYCLPTLEILKE